MKLFNLEGRNALVSGASRGIGKAIALGLAEAGADVAVAARTRDDLETVAHTISELGVRSLAVPLDVSQVGTIPAAVKQVEEGLGPIDILVNVAGINNRGLIQDLEEDAFDEVVAINFKGSFFMCKEVGKGMMERKRGKVINIASIVTAIGLPKITAYTGTKGALGQITKGLAVEWGPHNIQVNALAPGFIATDLNTHLWENQEFSRWCLDRTPAGRIGKPDDMIGTAVYLSSAASDFVTGQIIYVDGGIIAGDYWPL